MITKEQIELASNMSYCFADESEQKLLRKGFIEGANFVHDQDGWISVEERLPEKEGHYFVKVLNSFPKNCDVIVCEFYEDNKTFYSESSDSPIHDAIKWMPIPKS